MADKPRIRVPANSVPTYTVDSFQNLNQRLGLGSGSQQDGAGYAFSFISRNRMMLEAAYRTSWVVGKVVDAVAEDMTKAGITLDSVLPPGDESKVFAAWRDLMVGQGLADGIRWSRLYGGAFCVMLIDGQDLSTPLNIDSIGLGSFRGLLTFDRWSGRADTSTIVKTLGPDFGLPEFYVVSPDATQGIAAEMRIHYSRVLRFTGIPLPYYQRATEQLWGESVIERIWDRILAFDSTTTGVAQLVYKAHLRTLRVKGYRQLVAAGGQMFNGFLAQIENMRLFQNTEGLSVMDSEDEFQTHAYTFAGLDDVLTQMGDQVCGAVEIPRVRLFGESPGGLNADGESALRTYYDDIAKKQESKMRRPCQLLLDVMVRSSTGRKPPEGFTFGFAPLWQMSELDKSTVAKNVTDSVDAAFGGGIISQKVAMQELKASSKITGLFSNISDQDIEAAEEEIPDPVETAAALAEATNLPDPNAPDASEPGAGEKKPAKAE